MDDVRRVFDLSAEGWSKSEISRRTGVSRTQVRTWLAVGLDALLQPPMQDRAPVSDPCGPFCFGDHCPHVLNVDEAAYAYVLGQYLGDGTISKAGKGVYKLRIVMCDAYPNMMAECAEAIRAVMPPNLVSAYPRRGMGCTEVVSHSKHWPCLIPQLGAGMKHLRSISLEPWQERIALDRYPCQLLRGLIHSDGCRTINKVKGRNKDKPKQYSYPRYFFSNESADILGIFGAACDRLGVEWRANRRNMISVARRRSVALLDSFIGPKS